MPTPSALCLKAGHRRLQSFRSFAGARFRLLGIPVTFDFACAELPQVCGAVLDCSCDRTKGGNATIEADKKNATLCVSIYSLFSAFKMR